MTTSTQSAGSIAYRQYLKSEHWRLLRGAKLQMSPKCERCKSKEELEVHHKVYRDNWRDAKICDLETLCHCCHVIEHAVGGDNQKRLAMERMMNAQKPQATSAYEYHQNQKPASKPWKCMEQFEASRVTRKRRVL